MADFFSPSCIDLSEYYAPTDSVEVDGIALEAAEVRNLRARPCA